MKFISMLFIIGRPFYSFAIIQLHAYLFYKKLFKSEINSFCIWPCKLLLLRSSYSISFYLNIFVILYLKFFSSKIWLCLRVYALRLVFTAIPSVNPTLSTEIQATWCPGLLLQLYLGSDARVHELPNPLQGTLL